MYRVGKYGNNDKNAFLNYYEEVIRGLKTVRNREQALEKYRNNIDYLSVSCFNKEIDILIYYLSIVLKKEFPKRILLKGITCNSCGLSQLTSERKKSKGSHIDWWLFKNSKPWLKFSEVYVNES